MVIRRSILCIIHLFILSVAPAFASYSGLLLIPTTDLVPVGEYTIEMQHDFAVSSVLDQSASIFNTEYGIASNIEVGVDFDLSKESEGRALGNCKYVCSIKGLPIAIGISNINNKIKSLPYAIIGPSFGFGRMSLGILRSEGEARWFTGFDRQINDRWAIMADYTSGYENSSSIAVNYNLSPAMSILAGVVFPNDNAGNTSISVHFVMVGSARRIFWPRMWIDQ